MRDTDTGNSKGFAFINFASFDASDAALEAMNGQYLCNRPITISYAFKKDSKGERHGSEAERFLAAQNPLPQAERPHQLFADAPPVQAPGMQPPPAHMMPPPPGMPMFGAPMPGYPPFGMPPNMPPFPPGMNPFAHMGAPHLSIPAFAPAMMRPPPPPPPVGLNMSMMPAPIPPPPPPPSVI
jgi:splicing factor 3B subunit 4